MYAYVANNPVRYIDPDGNAAYSVYNQESGRYDFLADPSRTSEICSAIYSFVPFGTKVLDFIDYRFGLKYIESSSPLYHRLSTIGVNNSFQNRINTAISYFSLTNDIISVANLGGDLLNSTTKFSKVSSVVGKKLSYVGLVISGTSLFLAIKNIDGISKDLIIESLFGTQLSSISEKGVESKYLVARDFLNLMLDSDNLNYSFDEHNHIIISINNMAMIEECKMILNEME